MKKDSMTLQEVNEQIKTEDERIVEETDPPYADTPKLHRLYELKKELEQEREKWLFKQ